MRIAFHITAWLMLLISVVVLLEISLHVQGEQHLLQEEAQKRHRAVGELLQNHLQYTWSRNEPSNASRYLRRYNSQHTGTQWELVTTAELPAHIRSQLQHAQTHQPHPNATFWPPEESDSTTSIVGYWPIFSNNTHVAWLRGTAFLRSQEEHLRHELYRAVWVGVVVLCMSLIFSLVSGYILVGRPVQHLLNRFQQIKEGDWTHKPTKTRENELGTLETAFESMVSSLEDTRTKLQHEQEARQHAVQTLRQTDRLRSLGTLAAGIAHELGTPLHVIEGRASMMLHPKYDTSRTPKNLEIIIEQSQRMQRIVRRLMDLSRSDNIQWSPVDLVQVCQTAVEILSKHAQKHSVTLVLEPTDHIHTWTHGDRVLLEQALFNIIENAISVSPTNSTVAFGVTHNPDTPQSVGLFVEDQGPGMDETTRSQAFDPFFTTKSVGEGTGLGLSIVHGIIDEHKGHIEITTHTHEHNHGTRVVFWLTALNTPRQTP